MLEMTGFTSEELKSAGTGAIHGEPDERGNILNILQESGRVRDYKVRLKWKDGTAYFAILNAKPIELNGQKMFFILVTTPPSAKQTTSDFTW